MNDTVKKLTDQAREEIAARIADKTFADILSKTKAASDGDSGTFKVVVSTADRDRQNESVNQQGWDLTFFKSNPVVLWGHDYSSLPIGVCTFIEVRDGKLVAEGKFAPEDCNPFAQQVRRLYDAGMVRATSVGFIPKEFSTSNEGEITRAELLEFSFVPVPANPYALTMNQVKELKLDTTLLMTKGMQFEVKEDAPAPTPPVQPTEPDVPPADPVPPVEPTPPAPPAPVPPVEPPAPTTVPDDKAVEKAGRTISKKNGEIISQVCDCLEQSAATLRELMSSSNGSDIDDEDDPDAGKAIENKGRKPSQVPQTDLNEFMLVRTLMKDIDKVVGKGLETLNERARARKDDSKKS